MARERKLAGDRAHAGVEPGDWLTLAASGGLIGAVLLVLVLGALLKSPAPQPVPRTIAPLELVDPPVARADTPAPIEPARPALVPVDETAEGAVRQRTERDLGRLGRASGEWTLQIDLLCEVESVASLIARHGHETSLYVLPASHGGSPCYRVCWNDYASADTARRAADLPAGLRTLGAFPKSIHEVLR